MNTLYQRSLWLLRRFYHGWLACSVTLHIPIVVVAKLGIHRFGSGDPINSNIIKAGCSWATTWWTNDLPHLTTARHGTCIKTWCYCCSRNPNNTSNSRTTACYITCIITDKDNTKKWDTEQTTEEWLEISSLRNIDDLGKCQRKPSWATLLLPVRRLVSTLTSFPPRPACNWTVRFSRSPWYGTWPVSARSSSARAFQIE